MWANNLLVRFWVLCVCVFFFCSLNDMNSFINSLGAEAEDTKLQPLSWLSFREVETRARTRARGIVASGRSLRNSVKYVLKFALFRYQCIDFQSSGGVFPLHACSQLRMWPHFSSPVYLVLPLRAMRNYLDFKHIVDSSCRAQHLQPQHGCPPCDVRV